MRRKGEHSELWLDVIIDGTDDTDDTDGHRHVPDTAFNQHRLIEHAG